MIFSRFSARGLSLLLLFLALHSSQAKVPTLSTDGAFSLNAATSLSATRFSRMLSAYEKQFYQITGYVPTDISPIIVTLHESLTAAKGGALLRIDVLDGNLLRIQVDLSEEDVASSSTSKVLAEALLLREYYADKAPASGSPIANFPPWLLHGLGRLSQPEARPVLIPASYLRGGSPPSLEDLLIQKVPDGSNSVLLDVYDAMASTLLSAGLKSPEGGLHFREWIGHFNPKSPEHPASSWPPGWAMESVERRWLLLMAGMSGEDSGVVTLLGVEETIARYDEILLEVATSYHSLADLKMKKGANFIVQQLSERLSTLRLRANPEAVPLLNDTILLSSKLKHLSAKKISEKEKSLFDLRNEVLKRSRAIESYLDWYEAAKLPISSGLFENALQAPESSVKKGPVGQYLDTIEARGW